MFFTGVSVVDSVSNRVLARNHCLNSRVHHSCVSRDLCSRYLVRHPAKFLMEREVFLQCRSISVQKFLFFCGTSVP